MALLIALLAACALQQGVPAVAAPAGSDKPLAAPILTAGSNAAFQRSFLAVAEKLEAGDFPAAERLHRLLPKLSFTMAWDDANVPANLKSSFAEARDRAIRTWSSKFPNCTIKVVSAKTRGESPGVLISFVESIPARPEDPMPPGAVHFFSEDPSEPRLETVVSLTRGRPSVPTDFVDVHNEVAFSMAQFYGVERTISFGTYAARTDLPAVQFAQPGISDLAQAKDNVGASDKLAQAIQNKRRVQASRPDIHIDPLTLDMGQSQQGEIVPMRIQITNNGTGPLHIKALPDCSCVSVMRGGMLAPGETRLFPAQLDLTDVVGDFEKSILVYSNDFDRPMTRIPVRVKSKPLFRLIAENEGAVVLGRQPSTHKVYLVLPEGTKMTPKSSFFQGVDATVKFKPWSGDLADPDLGEPARPRKGYVFEVALTGEVPPGQTIGNLFIETDHPKYPQLQSNLIIQKGIVAMPDRIFYGEIPAAPRRSTFVLTRPRQGFRILSVSADTPFVNVTHQAQRGDWEYRFTVQFNGKAPTGPMSTTISIKTDDPGQPTIKVPVEALVR